MPASSRRSIVPDEVSNSDQVFLLKITARPGDMIKRPPDGNTILGFLGTTGNSFEEAFDTMNDFAAKIRVTFDRAGEPPLPSFWSTRDTDHQHAGPRPATGAHGTAPALPDVPTGAFRRHLLHQPVDGAGEAHRRRAWRWSSGSG